MTLKEKTYAALLGQVEKRMANAREAMQAAEDSRDNETKSSVGDKYETGRAMMQIEQEKNKVQLIKAIAVKKELAKININQRSDTVISGSMVKTNRGIYFMSIGIGKIIVDEQMIFAVSPGSPIGKLLMGKKVGDSFSFQGNEVYIEGMS